MDSILIISGGDFFYKTRGKRNVMKRRPLLTTVEST